MPTAPDFATIIGHRVPINHDFLGLPTAASTPSIVTASTYTVGASDVYVRVDTTSNAIALTLPAASTRYAFFLKDVGGVLETNNLTLTRAGSEKIENLSSNKILSTNYGGWLIWSDGTDVWIN